ncbi:TonB-dependent receptor [Sphingomonas naphthae]|uniref:TonB-dependent receptor n=1 Tax=Sphingomonas naphthae TaxID=1813468 RepID=A0ABY7TLD9_9SPHN|nr:TonB-dependent receptor [Sphingomonas naphthae]WCT73791.1 TonB-dependent receptor [Sphingomonas naphthae]
MGRRIFAGAGILAIATSAQFAAAQVQGAAAGDGAAQAAEAEIVITASRTGASGFRAPTPTTVVGAQALEQRQATNVADVLQELPAFKPSSSPSANGIKTQLPGTNQADLRSLGANRTLVLVDGMRVVPQAPANNTGVTVSPDLNQIPALMVERIDVVTGGASAQWGSDAVGGVVNVLLRKKFDGLKLTAQAGVSELGDAAQRRVGGVGGLNLLDDRLHIVAALDYTSSDEVGDLYTRDWGRRENQIVTNSASATNGLPVNLIVPGVRFYSSPDLLVTSSTVAAFRNRTFTGGQLVPFDAGSLIGGQATIGGQGFSQALNVSLVPGVRRLDPYARVQFDVSDAAKLYVVGSYSKLRSTLTPLPSRITGGTIRSDNAYLRQLYPAVAAALGSAGTLTFNRVNYDFYPQGRNGRIVVKNETPHIAGGIEGDLGGGWRYDAHVGWGRNTYRNTASGIGIRQRETFATDAVLFNGAITCRALVPGSTTYNPTAAAGCVPINLFGAGSPSAEAIGYVTGTSRAKAVYTQTTAAANVHGEPFETWAGPVALAAGVEYRREKEAVTADAIAAAGGFEIANAGPFRGDFDVKEGYVEALVPLLRDSPLGRSLDINGAVRVADYSSVGRQTTWKAGATYEPIRGIRLRGTASLDIRAPALFELFSPGSVANNTVSVRNPANGISYSANIPVNISRGNADLNAERSHTYTGGIVLEPAFAPGLSLSVDYYDIEVKDAITTLTSTAAGSLCNSGDSYYCSAFTFGATGAPTALNLGVQNLASVRVKGFDAVLAYRLPLHRLASSLPGTIEVNITGTRTADVLVDTGTGSGAVDRAGENSSLNTYATPSTRFTASTTYSVGGFSGTVQTNFISAGTIDNLYNSSAATTASRNHVPAFAYVNLFANQKVGDRFELFASIRNVLNTDPPAVPNPQLYTGTNGTYYDTIGRYFTAGVRVTF